MKTVIRTDRAPLRKPVITSQGFYRADAHVARVGIYEYRNDDGTIRRELRPQEEVSDPASLASYDTAPVTLNHPKKPDGTPDEVTAENVKRLKIGTVAGSARMDDDHVAATVQVEDAAAIKRAKGGTQELSPGYRIVLDETPGADPRYGYPGNPEGRWDAKQTKIRVNHVALVDSARGGRTTRLRIDSAMPMSMSGGDSDVALTSIVKGHQHTIDADRMCCTSCGFGCNGSACPYCGGISKPMSSGSTSYAMSDGAEDGHSHEWLRAEDGTFTLSMNDGHAHDFVAPAASTTAPAPGFAGRADTQFDRSPPPADREHMSTPNQPPDAAEQLRLLTVRADEAERTITEQRTRADTAESRAETHRADLVTAQERIKTLEAQIAAGSTLVETAAVLEQRTRADTAERELSDVRSQIPHLVRKRAGTIAKTMAVVGPTMRADAMTEREMLCAAVKHLRPKEDIGNHVSTDYLERRLDSLVEDRTSHAVSMARASATLSMRVDAVQPTQPAGTANKPVSWADQWRGGARQYATKKD